MNTFFGILIPFIGTTLGAACVFFMKKTLGKSVQRALTGFAAGVMVAASIWSLLIPAIKQSENTYDKISWGIKFCYWTSYVHSSFQKLNLPYISTNDL